MLVYQEKTQIKAELELRKVKGQVIGFVPTMGALHQGHLALVKQALNSNDIVVVSIFVNPTQFNNASDLEKYPRTFDSDIALLESLNEDRIMVYTPSVDDIYEGNLRSQKFDFDGLEREMEGKYRPGHFDGVATVVKRFFEIVNPDNAYFGEKDFQQLAIIKRMVNKNDIPVTIIGCKIHRESDGLAMSSRNARLTSEQRNAAPFIYAVLKEAKQEFASKSANEVVKWVEEQFKGHGILELEYFIIADEKTLRPIRNKTDKRRYRAFIAVYADDIRLIDNIALN
ncbi:pantoate--beta-alanine ligase [Aestuariivivens sediminicola]|uniref:pantoate--beta-alanine ligase n=1 Tax=Aestuariivivens sediminicola TaxID=2913560 RepID=UPI0030DAB17D